MTWSRLLEKLSGSVSQLVPKPIANPLNRGICFQVIWKMTLHDRWFALLPEQQDSLCPRPSLKASPNYWFHYRNTPPKRLVSVWYTKHKFPCKGLAQKPLHRQKRWSVYFGLHPYAIIRRREPSRQICFDLAPLVENIQLSPRTNQPFKPTLLSDWVVVVATVHEPWKRSIIEGDKIWVSFFMRFRISKLHFLCKSWWNFNNLFCLIFFLIH